MLHEKTFQIRKKQNPFLEFFPFIPKDWRTKAILFTSCDLKNFFLCVSHESRWCGQQGPNMQIFSFFSGLIKSFFGFSFGHLSVRLSCTGTGGFNLVWFTAICRDGITADNTAWAADSQECWERHSHPAQDSHI